MITKLKKCQKCCVKPLYMSVDGYSGYLTCIFCQKSTPVFSNDLESSWKKKAKLSWNLFVEDEERKCQIKHMKKV